MVWVTKRVDPHTKGHYEETSMSRISRISMITFALIATGCDAAEESSVLGPAARTSILAENPTGMSLPVSAAAPGTPVHMVSGGVIIDWAVYEGGKDKYAFHATKDAQGRVRGSFQSSYLYEFTETEFFNFHADVVCLQVQGSHAWLGIRVTRSNDPAFMPVGTTGVVRVFDSGEGHHWGTPDDPYGKDAIGELVTSVDASYCDTKPTIREFWYLDYIDHGNIQVR
jgi:hypothetical protein